MNAKSNQYSCPKAYEVLRGPLQPPCSTSYGTFLVFPFCWWGSGPETDSFRDGFYAECVSWYRENEAHDFERRADGGWGGGWGGTTNFTTKTAENQSIYCRLSITLKIWRNPITLFANEKGGGRNSNNLIMELLGWLCSSPEKIAVLCRNFLNSITFFFSDFHI